MICPCAIPWELPCFARCAQAPVTAVYVHVQYSRQPTWLLPAVVEELTEAGRDLMSEKQAINAINSALPRGGDEEVITERLYLPQFREEWEIT